MKLRPVGAELFYADRQADMTKQVVAFRNFANAPVQTSQLMLYREIIAVCSQIHTKQITWIIYKDPVRTAQ